MPTAKHRKILVDILSLPTAPFAEHMVLDHIRSFCAKRKNVTLKADRVGNLLVRVRQGNRRVARPICITAHLDHPGFVSDRMIKPGTLRAFWRGGVLPEYFVGTGVRFWVEGKWVRGVIQSIRTKTSDGRKQVETADIEVSKKADIPSRSIGMWNLPEPAIRGQRIYARGCDDIAGAASMLCCIDELVRKRQSCDAYFLFTRAEEVGFIGAIDAARSGTIPSKCIVVAMETSAELPSAKMGDGPILRVGDKATVFSPSVTAHCEAIAQQLAKKNKRFKFQRKLMDGGACEGTAYCLLGIEATGMCLALGNYHNMDKSRGKIASEYVNLQDFDQVVDWFVELARGSIPYKPANQPMRKRIDGLAKTYRSLLRASAKGPR